MNKFILLSIFLFAFSTSMFSQQEFTTEVDSVSMEVYLIDAYVKQEPPYTFILSFYTSEVCLSNVIIDGKYEYQVSNELSEAHSAQIDISDLKFLDRNINFVIETIDSLGNKNLSEEFEFDLPYEPEIGEGSSIWTLCLFAGSVFVLPMPGYVNANGNHYYSLTKEIPIVSFRAKKGNYPSGYLAFEYTYIFDAENKNFARLGYKKLFPIDYIEYISAGATAYTNFSGQNGFAPEISLGWFTLFDTFTVYTRYRYNFKPNDSNSNFHEINLGLYTRFFSLYL
ncbi:MAG: hypothetical protein IT276_08945 [Ignavibacteriaceae bacterium]|nr:hypothetical protein [Ignavibacteriaceae bacterium]HRN25627.1 hypothetical protein [Ignavibacteriaceae bacterium]HRP92458.1 hypothetical protein [Ignavibacteriaceae bacterium]HRQ53246.1 hypothetical protein [Ignavibacteriaceae bacterium]